MNYLEPSMVVDAVVKKLNADISDFTFNNYSVKAIGEIARKPETDEGITPPWLAVSYFFDEDGEVLPQGYIYNLPISIIVVCSSTPGQSTDANALREAMHYAKITFNKLLGDYTINIGTEQEPEERCVFLKSAKRPFEILEVGADLSMVAVVFEYLDTF